MVIMILVGLVGLMSLVGLVSLVDQVGLVFKGRYMVFGDLKRLKMISDMVLMSFQMKVGTLMIRRNLIIPRSSMIQKEFKLEIYTLIIPNLRPQKKKFYDALENSKSSLPS